MPRYLKALIGLLLCALLAAGVDWHSLPAHVARLHWPLAGLAVLVVALELPVNASKWWWSLQLHGLSFSWSHLFRTGCIAYFLNNFLPSAIGGDVYRVYRTVAAKGEKSGAVSAVLVERIVGFGAMLSYGALAAILLAQEHELARSYLTVAISGAAAFAPALVIFHFASGSRFADIWRRFAWLEPVTRHLQYILRPRFAWLPLFGFSLLFQLLAAAVVWLAFLAVGCDISMAQAMLITAAAGIASALPISISGLGVVEGAIAGTAVALGIHYDDAVFAAIAVRILVLPISAACGLFLLTSRRQRANLPGVPELN